MAHLLANNPGHQDAGEILLSGFTQMALHMEAQRRLMKPGSKPRRGKKAQKKQPQRGLGVAQLEKIRLEEQRRASQHVQQLAALRQLQGGAPSHAAHLTMPTILPQIPRESNQVVLQATQPRPITASSAAVARAASIDSITNSFLFKNVAPLGSIAHPSSPATTPPPLDLFPQEKHEATSSYLWPSDCIWSTDKNPYLRQLIPDSEGRASAVKSPSKMLALTCNQRSVEGQDDSGPNYPFLQLRRKSTSILDLWNPSQVPGRVAAPPSFSLERMMELSFFQSTESSRDDQHLALKRRALGVVQLGGQLSELPAWMTPPSCAHSKASQEHESHGRNNMDVCELTLRPPGEVVASIGVKVVACQQPGHGQERNRFLSLSVGACSSWQDSSAAESTPCSSSAPSPVSITTTCKSSAHNEASTTDEYMSSSTTGCSRLPSFFSMMESSRPEGGQEGSPYAFFDASLDLTLKL